MIQWVMVLEYMKKQASTLMKLDENRYSIDYYMYIVWTGGLEYWWEGAFSTTQIQDWKDKYDIVENDTKVYKCS